MSFERASYLRARDPTFTWGRNQNMASLRVNLHKEQFNCTECNDVNTEQDGHIQVYLRIRKESNFPSQLYSGDDNTLICKPPKSSHCMKNIRENNLVSKHFKFTKIFLPSSSQKNLFDDIVRKPIFQFLNGYHCNLFTYGASGSGKTFTISGTIDQPGIVPRTLEYLFRSISNLPRNVKLKPTENGDVIRLSQSESERELRRKKVLLENLNSTLHEQTYRAMQERLSNETAASVDTEADVHISLWVSYVEIYNEYLYDLLAPEPTQGQSKHKLRLGHDSGVYHIKDLTHIYISSGLEAYQILQYGLHKLKFATTSLNNRSSRSHSIFTIKMVQASDKLGGTTITSFNFCDLAGSERLKKTHNTGDRLKESNNINTSLLVLGRCINLVREANKQKDVKSIPFRESKLTQLFQNALLGKESVLFIVNVNLIDTLFEENQHVLNFSAIAKDVVVKTNIPRRISMGAAKQKLPKESKSKNNDEWDNDEYMEELMDNIVNIRNQLDEAKSDNENVRENIAATYDQIINETHAFWKERCQKLRIELVELQRNTRKDHSDSSSSDLDNSTPAVANKCKQYILEVEDLNEEAKLQKEFNELQNRSILNRAKIEALKNENIGLEKKLDEAGKSYRILKLNYENDIKEHTQEVLRQQAELADLDYLENSIYEETPEAN